VITEKQFALGFAGFWRSLLPMMETHIRSTNEQLQTATRSRELAAQQLTQSRDRFAAGVASNVEVIQAQETVTLAAEQYISALYGFNIAKAMLAGSVGSSPEDVERFLNDLKRTLGPPWSAEHRNAFAAAIGQLDRRRLRRLA